MIRPERECLIPSGRDGDDVGQSRSLHGRKTVPDDAAMTPLKNGAVRHERNAELVAGGDDRRIRKADDFDGDGREVGRSVSQFSGGVPTPAPNRAVRLNRQRVIASAAESGDRIQTAHLNGRVRFGGQTVAALPSLAADHRP